MDLNRSIIFRFYCLITAIITVITIVVGARYIEREKEYMLISLQNDLTNAAAQLERSFSRSEIAADLSTEDIDEELKVIKLNEKYQPYIEQVQKEYPNFSFGIYARDLDRIIALTDKSAENLQKKKYDERYFKIFETAKIEMQDISVSVHWGSNPIVNVQYPIIVDGKLVGFTWAGFKQNEIQSAVDNMIVRLSLYCFLIWLVSILFVRLLVKRLFMAMNDLIVQIKQDNTSTERFRETPELIPLVNTINEKRAALESVYQQREKIMVEKERTNRLKLVGEMAASVAHEIRNPMTSVQGFLQFVKKNSDKKIAQYMDIALSELLYANKIIDDLLALARNRFVEKGPENINEIIKRLAPVIRADCLKKGVILQLSLKDLPSVFVSSKEIKQLIINLTCNALDAMGKDGRLTISTDYEAEDVCLLVADNGKGIPPDELNNIFEPFYTTKNNQTGLGLVVCQSIIEHHGGTIEIESEVGIGTVFTVRLPVYEGK